jgi:hypothetical protein
MAAVLDLADRITEPGQLPAGSTGFGDNVDLADFTKPGADKHTVSIFGPVE